jgi:hypothetical protein
VRVPTLKAVTQSTAALIGQVGTLKRAWAGRSIAPRGLTAIAREAIRGGHVHVLQWLATERGVDLAALCAKTAGRDISIALSNGQLEATQASF